MLNLLTLLLTSSFVLLPLVWLRPPDPSSALNFSEWLAHEEGTVTGTHLRPRRPPTRVQPWDPTGPAFARQHLLTQSQSSARAPPLRSGEGQGLPAALGALPYGPSLPPSQPSSALVVPSLRRVLSISTTSFGTF